MIIYGTPFIPGVGTGHIQREWQTASSRDGTVALISDASLTELQTFKKNPPNAILICGLHQFSHLVLYLFEIGVPAAFIEHDALGEFEGWVSLDGTSGQVETASTKNQLKSLKKNDPSLGISSQFSVANTVTLDGTEIFLEASVNDAPTAANALAVGAHNIGVTRSEFLFPNATGVPSKADHTAALNNIVRHIGEANLSIRLFDFDRSKTFSWVPASSIYRDSLGVRGARTYFDPNYRPLIENQLDGIGNVERDGGISLLIPFVTSPSEFDLIKSDIQKRIGELEVHPMLEVPAAVMRCGEFVQQFGGATIGTNDLLQCYFGASREIQELSTLVDIYDMGLLNFWQQIANRCGDHLGQVRLCGHYPLSPFILEILICFGFRRFSVEPLFFETLSRRIKALSTSELKPRLFDALERNSSVDVDILIKGS